MKSTDVAQDVKAGVRPVSGPVRPLKPTPKVNAGLHIDDHERLAPLRGIMWGLALCCSFWIALGLVIAAIW